MIIKDLRDALKTLILLNADVTAMIDTRVFPHRLPQGERRPSVVYNRVAGDVDYHMQGPSGLATTRMQVDAWAADPDAASVLARNIRSTIEAFAGDIVVDDGSPLEMVHVQGIFVESLGDDYDGGVDLYRERVDYRIVWDER